MFLLNDFFLEFLASDSDRCDRQLFSTSNIYRKQLASCVAVYHSHSPTYAHDFVRLSVQSIFLLKIR